MAKLKYDRPINIGLGKNKYVTVPEGEVWKVSTRQSVNAFATNLYGGGTHSLRTAQRLAYQASPSSTSKSKRIHGGDSPWLENLFSTDLFGWSQNPQWKLMYPKTRFGNYALQIRITSIRSIPIHTNVLLAAAPKLRQHQQMPASPASLLKSSSNDDVEGVTLYA